MSAIAPSPDPQQVLPAGQTVLGVAHQLGKNPQLIDAPLGAYTDSQYAAQNAILRNNIAKQYADVLQQLGYRDENGNFIMGSVESGAQKQDAQYRRSQQLAAEGVTQDAQRGGTLFSGIRGTLQARAEEPYVGARADLAASVPLTLQQLYEHAAGLTNDYTLQQNQLLADAAQRAAQNIIVQPPASTPGAGGGGGASAAGADSGAGGVGTITSGPAAPLDPTAPAAGGTTPDLAAMAASGFVNAGGGGAGAGAPIISSTGTPEPMAGPAPGSLEAIVNQLYPSAGGGPSGTDPYQPYQHSPGLAPAPAPIPTPMPDLSSAIAPAPAPILPPVLPTGGIAQPGTAYIPQADVAPAPAPAMVAPPPPAPAPLPVLAPEPAPVAPTPQQQAADALTQVFIPRPGKAIAL